MNDDEVRQFVAEIVAEMLTCPRGTPIRTVLLHRAAQGDLRAAEVLALSDAAFSTPGFLDSTLMPIHPKATRDG